MKDNSGSFNKNKRKETDKHPDYSGSAMVGGTAYWISAWRKDSDDGPWISLSFKPKEQATATKERRQRTSDDDGDLPF